MVQEVGFAKLRGLGIEFVAADGPNAFLDDGPTSKLIRQVLGAVAETRQSNDGCQAARRLRAQAARDG